MMNKIIPGTAREQLFAATALFVVSAILYLGKTLLIPMLLAVLLSFVLTPPVLALQRRGMHRILAVCLAMALTLVGAAGLCLMVYSEISSLIQELPTKQVHIVEKIRFFTGEGPSTLRTLTDFLENINKSVQEGDSAFGPSEQGESQRFNKPVESKGGRVALPVAVESSPSDWLNISSLALSAQHALGFVTLVVGLCSSMLISREDLRNRFIFLIGQGNVTSTTKAMEEVNRRISRYLLGQVVLNGTFGVLFALGLVCLRVEYALMWGLLAAVLRFIPGLGTWMAAVIPVVISLATPGWWQPLSVMGLTAILGVIFNYVVEPVIFSDRTGVSIVSLVIMAAFWTWLWGLPGLIMATPISVCLLVLGSHIPMFHFLFVMLAKESVLDTKLSFYQRLLADDEDEAADLLEGYGEEHTPEEISTEVLLPTLVYAQNDVLNHLLTAEELTRILQVVDRLIDQILVTEDSNDKVVRNERATSSLLACASHDQREELALKLFGLLLPPDVGRMEIIGDKATISEIAERVRRDQPAAFCIVSLVPRGPAQARLRYKRLRKLFPDLPIILAFWGGKPEEAHTNKQDNSGSDAQTKVTRSMLETLNVTVPLLRLALHRSSSERKIDRQEKAVTSTKL